jgi:hypothetical protein
MKKSGTVYVCATCGKKCIADSYEFITFFPYCLTCSIKMRMKKKVEEEKIEVTPELTEEKAI